MNRRALLATLAGLSGCATLPRDASRTRTTNPALRGTPTDEPTDTPGGTDTPEDGGTGSPFGDRTSLVDLETVRRTYALAPTAYRTDDGARVELRFVETATADHPARVEARLTNASAFENTFRLRETPPFGHDVWSRNPRRMWEEYGSEHTYRESLVMAPTQDHDLVEHVPEVTRDDDGQWRVAEQGSSDWLPETVRLAPDESVSGEYVLVGHPDGEGRGRPSGIYEFRSSEADLRVTVWDTDEPGPDRESRFAGRSVPDLPREGTTAWFHEADATTPSFVRPATERDDLPAAFDFHFVNRSREASSCGHWDLYKLVDDEWFHVAPWVRTADCRFVLPGGVVPHRLRAYHGESVPCEGARSVGFLGGGTYGVVAGYGHETDRSGALVEMEADPVELVPTAGATSERDGDTVTVTTPEYGDGEHPPDATLTLERTDDDPDAERLVAEQVMGRPLVGLRTSLAFFGDDVDSVVLRTDEHVADRAVGYDADRRTFRFRGETYEARAEYEGSE